MKKTFTLLLISCSLITQAQIGGITLGYKLGNVKLDTYNYEIDFPDSPNPDPETDKHSFNTTSSLNNKYRSISIGGEYAMEYAFLKLNFDVPLYNDGVSNTSGLHLKGKPTSKVNGNDLILAGGFGLGADLYLLFGIQLGRIMNRNIQELYDSSGALSDVMAIDPYNYNNDSYDKYFFDYFGGKKRGGNVTLMYLLDENLCVRNTFSYGIAKFDGIPSNQNWNGLGYRGTFFTNQTAVSVMVEKVGLKLEYNYDVMNLNTVSLNDNDGVIYTYIPNNKSILNNLSFSIIFSLAN